MWTDADGDVLEFRDGWHGDCGEQQQCADDAARNGG